MVSACVMLGSDVNGVITPDLPSKSKTILSTPPTLAVLLAAEMASRSEIRPSAPRFAPSRLIEPRLPSATSL